MRPAFVVLAVLALLLGGVGQARAGLVGSTVHATYDFPYGTLYQDNGTQIVTSPSVSFTASDPTGYVFLTETVSDTQISLQTNDIGLWSGPFQGPLFDFLGSGNLISGVTVNGATNWPGFDQSRVTLISDGAGGQIIEVNLGGLNVTVSSDVILDVTTSSVPEPSTLLVWSGLGAIGAVMAYRRKRRAA